MKIIDRAAFLALPVGTLFSKFDPHAFGPLAIKGESTAHDFWVQDLDGPLKANGTGEWIDAIERAQDGADVEIDLDVESRDGLYDKDQLFAVWSPDEVRTLIARLSKAVEDSERPRAR